MATKATTTKKEAPVSKTLEATLYNQSAKSAGTISLPEAVFGVKWNADLVHQVATGMLANARAGTAHTKDRGEVSGGGKKPWKQKGTGRARHGSSRSPIWVGGGVTFGPRAEKDYSKKINKKMRAKALFAVLSKKFAAQQVVFLDNVQLTETKTKGAMAVLKNLASLPKSEKLVTKKKTAGLMLIPEHNEVVERSFANIPSITVMPARDTNVLDALKFGTIIIVGEASVAALAAKMK